jgi:VanZ family protein
MYDVILRCAGSIWCALAYSLILLALLLAPYDFYNPLHYEDNGVVWLRDTNGVAFTSTGAIFAATSNNIFDPLVHGDGLTMEVWLKVGNLEQGGPARIISYSRNPTFRNFTLGQEQSDLVIRLRTTNTDPNGTEPQLVSKGVFEIGAPQHIVVTYDFLEQVVYVDGRVKERTSLPGGRFTNWDRSHAFLLGNERTGNRPWLGQIFLIGIYNRSLSAEEVAINHRAGYSPLEKANGADGRVSNGLVALYLFDEGAGQQVLDHSGSQSLLRLQIPDRILTQETTRTFLESPYWELNNLPKSYAVADYIFNVIVFIPVGLLWYQVLKKRARSVWMAGIAVLAATTLCILGVETLHFFERSKTSSMSDVIHNTLGTGIGIILAARRR